MRRCGGVGSEVVVVVAVVIVMFSPVSCHTGYYRGMFQLYKSCGSPVQLTTLVLNNPMWLRGEGEPITLVNQQNPSEECTLQPDITHQIHVGGVASGKEEEEREEKRSCTFPKQTFLLFGQGLLKVSCLLERSDAEVEMLDTGESASSAPSPAGRTSSPEGRALGLPSPGDTTEHTPTTWRPPDTDEQLPEGSTLRPPTSTVEDAHPSGAQSTTTETVTDETPSSTKHQLTDEEVTHTTPWKQLTEIPDDSPEWPLPVMEADVTVDTTDGRTHKTESPEHMAQTKATTGVNDGTTQQTPSISGTHETRQTEETTPPAGIQETSMKKASIFIHGSSAMSNAPQSGGHTPDEPNDQLVYLAGAGAGVLALVLGVVAVASVAHHRRRKSKAKQREDLFISGAYRGSAHSLTHSGSGNSCEKGAYLNTNVMFYSGAEPEFVESFEMEEKILKGAVSYSSHDIPKCLK